MALTVEVTKKNVTEIMSGLWNITFNLRCLEDAAEVINQDVSAEYRAGEDIAVKQDVLLADMQKIINKWQSEQLIFDHTKMNNLAVYLQANLVG